MQVILTATEYKEIKAKIDSIRANIGDNASSSANMAREYLVDGNIAEVGTQIRKTIQGIYDTREELKELEIMLNI